MAGGACQTVVAGGDASGTVGVAAQAIRRTDKESSKRGTIRNAGCAL